MAGERLNLTSDSTRPPVPETARPFVGVQFTCCGVYMRVYRNAQATAYEGRCPKCAKPLRIAIGAGGTASRFFEAG